MHVIVRAAGDTSATIVECDHVTFGKVREPADSGLKLFAKDSGGYTAHYFDVEDVVAVLP
jgi:hypothetical protein